MKNKEEIRHFIHQQIIASLKAHQKLPYDLPLMNYVDIMKCFDLRCLVL